MMGVAAAAVRAQVAAQQGGRNTSPPFAVRSSGEMASTLPLVTAANSLDKRNRTRQMDDLDGQLFVLCVFGHAEGENLWHTLRCFEDGAESVCKYKIPRYPAAALLSLSLSLSLCLRPQSSMRALALAFLAFFFSFLVLFTRFMRFGASNDRAHRNPGRRRWRCDMGPSKYGNARGSQSLLPEKGPGGCSGSENKRPAPVFAPPESAVFSIRVDTRMAWLNVPSSEST
jgi:hypothetical protein